MLRYLTVNTCIELVCFIIALFYLNKKAGSAWQAMILFLFIICVTELFGIYFKIQYLKDVVHNLPNSWLYNLLLICQILFISFHFNYLLRRYTDSKLLIWAGISLLTIVYGYELFEHGFFKYNILTYTVMSVVFIGFSLYYYYNLLKDNEYVDLRLSPDFWWVTGALFFYFGSIICSLFYYKLSKVIITEKHYLTYYIYNALNIILYSCWSYAFICKKWQTSKPKNSY